VDLGLALVRIEQRRHKLEDLFRDGPDGTNVTPMPDAAPATPPGPDR
jgi:hypothetical protein